MKTKIIMIRHGFSVANDKKIYAGSKDYPLSKLGLKQAEACGKWFANKKVDAIYSSHLKRAYETALPISLTLGLEINVDKDLRECDGGDWEGLTYDELCEMYPQEYGVWCNDIGKAVCPNGESVKAFSERITNAVVRIAENNVGKIVCIATHATPIRVITALAKNIPVEELAKVEWTSNASINIFEYKDGRFTVIRLNDDEYLQNMRSKLPDNV